MTTKNEYVWNELRKRGIKWTADLDDMVNWEISIADGKDTARKIASSVMKKLSLQNKPKQV